MLHGGESSLLFKHIRELTGEIEEQKRQIAKEEEIGERLNEIMQEKNQQISTLKLSNKELEETVKQNQVAVINQKHLLERLRQNASLMRQQLDSKKEEIQKQKDEADLIQKQCQERLQNHQNKFESYLKLYENLPGVSEHIKTKRRATELEAAVKNAVERLNEAKKAKMAERSRMLGIDESKMFSSLQAWGVALAAKYIEHKKDLEERERLSSEAEKCRKNIEVLKMKSENMAKVQAEEAETRRKAQLSQCSQQQMAADPRNKENCVTKTSDAPKKTRFANFNLMQKSPLQLSVPNLRAEPSDKSFKKYMPSFTFKSPSLMRSKSLSSLAKGSSGTSVKRSESITTKPLQKWLASANTQGNVDVTKPLTIPKLSIRTVAKEVEVPKLANPFSKDTAMDWTSKDLHQNMTIPETPSPKPLSSDQSHGGFGFGGFCMSPEEDFKFTPHVLPATPFDKRIVKVDSVASSSVPNTTSTMLASARTSHDDDFKFAVPTAPPPGRLMRRARNKSEEKHSQDSTNDRDIFSSPFSSAMMEDDSFDAAPTTMSFSFMANDEEPSGSAFSLFGRNMETETVSDEPPISHGFPMFNDDEEKPSPFGSLFSLK